jgi:hypothetical protein
MPSRLVVATEHKGTFRRHELQARQIKECVKGVNAAIHRIAQQQIIGPFHGNGCRELEKKNEVESCPCK